MEYNKYSADINDIMISSYSYCLSKGRAKQAEEKMLAAQEERRTLLAEKAALLGEVGNHKDLGFFPCTSHVLNCCLLKVEKLSFWRG